MVSGRVKPPDHYSSPRLLLSIFYRVFWLVITFFLELEVRLDALTISHVSARQ